MLCLYVVHLSEVNASRGWTVRSLLTLLPGPDCTACHSGICSAVESTNFGLGHTPSHLVAPVMLTARDLGGQGIPKWP